MKLFNPFYVIFFFLQVMTLPGYAQKYNLPAYIDIVQYDQNGYNVISILVAEPEDPYVGTRGSPFLYKDNVDSCYLFMEDSVIIEDLVMNYDVYLQEMHIYTGDSTYGVLYPQYVEEIHIAQNIFINTLFDINDVGYFGYLERLTTGKYQLLKRYICQKNEGYYNIPLSFGDRSFRFDKFTSYFIKVKGKSASKIDLKKRKIFELLPGDDKELIRFMKENRINLKKEDELIQLINYYNSISI